QQPPDHPGDHAHGRAQRGGRLARRTRVQHDPPGQVQRILGGERLMILTQDRSAAVGNLLVAVGQPYVFESLELPAHEFRTQDTDNPVGDGKLFGRDRLTPGRATLNLLVVGDDAAEAHAHMRAFSAAWSGLVDRTKPGAVAHLEWRDGGITRRVYGRPRTLAANVDDSRNGLIRVTAAFDLSDA